MNRIILNLLKEWEFFALKISNRILYGMPCNNECVSKFTKVGIQLKNLGYNVPYCLSEFLTINGI
jgi:hypothetical protein